MSMLEKQLLYFCFMSKEWIHKMKHYLRSVISKSYITIMNKGGGGASELNIKSVWD